VRAVSPKAAAANTTSQPQKMVSRNIFVILTASFEGTALPYVQENEIGLRVVACIT